MIISQRVFSTGIVDKGLLGRSDSNIYQQGLLQLDNMDCTVFGGLNKRTGSNFLTDMNNITKSVLPVTDKDYRYSVELTDDKPNIRYITFSSSPSASSKNNTKDYIVVLTEKKLAIFDTSFNGDKSKYKNLVDRTRFNSPEIEGFSAISTSSGVVTWSIVTEYLSNELKDIKVVQSKDTMFLCHHNHKPKVLTNKGLFFELPNETDDIPPKRDVITKDEVYWGFEDFGFISVGVTAANSIARGVDAITFMPTEWTGVSKYPATVAIHQNRVVFGGGKVNPLGLWFSKSGDYSDFSILNNKDEVAPEVGIHTAIDSGVNESIIWLNTGKTLTIGTTHSEYILTADARGLSSLTMAVVPQTRLGSSNIQPLQVNNELVFVQSNSLSISKFVYNFNQNQYTTENLSLTIPKLLALKIVDMCLVNSFTPTIMLLTEGGEILRLLHDKSQKVTGYSKYSITNGKIIAMSPIRNPVNGSDTLYYCVKRGESYSMEKAQDTDLTKIYDSSLAKWYSPYLDSHSNHYSITDTVKGLYRFNGYKLSELVIHSDGIEYQSTSDEIIKDGIVKIRIPTTEASKYMTIGLEIQSRLVTLPLNIPTVRKSDIGDDVTYKSTSNIYMNLLNAGLYMKVRVFNKTKEGNWVTKSFRKASDKLGERSELFEGTTDNLIVSGNYSNTVQMEVVHTASSSFTILAIHTEIQK